MPSAALDFRTVCGCFCPVFQAFMLKRVRQKRALYFAMLTVKRRADGVALGLLLTYLFWGSLLLRCGDVESNPGPNPSQNKDKDKDGMKQTRLSSTRSSSIRASIDRTDNPSSGSPSETTNQPTQSDVMGMLHSLSTRLDTKIGEVKEEIRILYEDYVAMKDELKGLREEVVTPRQQNDDLKRRNDDFSRRIEDLDRKTDDLEGRSKRNNLIFYSLTRRDNETPAECEGIVKDLLTDKLELSHDVEFDRVHRINSKSDSPVIARCVFYKQKIDVLKAKGKLRGSQIFIAEDFSSHVREVRRRLTPHLKRARSEGKRAPMVFNHLLIDGKKYCVDSGDRLVEMR